MASFREVVSTEWLKNRIKNPRGEKLRILDVTWYPNRDAKEDYAKKHIPGAAYFNAFQGVELTPVYPRKLADAATFQKIARESGVDNDSHVIVYDANEGKNGMFFGPRVWFMFKIYGHENVSVLDGGLEKWIADGYEVTDKSKKIPEGNFEAKDCSAPFVKTYDEMMKHLSSKDSEAVVDARPPGLYNGNADDPKSGHFPGSINLPWSSAMAEGKKQGVLKSVHELKQMFKDAGIDLTKPPIFTCIGGVTSLTLALCAQMCGCQQYSVHMGAMTEWSHKADEKYIERS